MIAQRDLGANQLKGRKKCVNSRKRTEPKHWKKGHVRKKVDLENVEKAMQPLDVQIFT